MKTVKITLAVLVLGAIGYFVINNVVDNTGVVPTVGFNDQFVKRIEAEIEAIRKMPVNRFCVSEYRNTMVLINDYYKPEAPTYPYGRLGKTQKDNDVKREMLSKSLHAAYAEKFVEQAFYVFNRSDWPVVQLNTIRNETSYVMNNGKFDSSSKPYNDIAQIRTILAKYDEINIFVNTCSHFSYTSTDLTNSRFPIDQVRSNIAKASSYINSGMGNKYVKKCSRLHNALVNVNRTLFNSHKAYLIYKIDYWSGSFKDYNSHRDYVLNLYNPIKAEIEMLDNDIYNINNFYPEYDYILSKWNVDNSKAYKHIYIKKPTI